MNSNIKVFARISPTDSEKVSFVQEENSLNLFDKCFQYEQVFDCRTDQQYIYNSIALPVIQKVLDGHNSSIICYGATGSGKTYTSIGNKENPGLVFNILKYLVTNDYYVTLSAVQIDNTIQDLLQDNKEILGQQQIYKSQVNIIKVHQNVEQILQNIIKQRLTKPTPTNNNSSRTHLIFLINVNNAQLLLADLAGSESLQYTKENHTPQQKNLQNLQKEGIKINLGLFSLKKILFQNIQNHQYISYRDHPLTYILQSSFGGDSLANIILHINNSQQKNDILNTLNFGADAMKIENITKDNIMSYEELQDQLINALKRQNINEQQNVNDELDQALLINDQNKLIIQQLQNEKQVLLTELQKERDDKIELYKALREEKINQQQILNIEIQEKKQQIEDLKTIYSI